MLSSRLVILTVVAMLAVTLSFGAYSIGRSQANEAKTRLLVDHIIPQMVEQMCSSVNLYFNSEKGISTQNVSASLTDEHDADSVVKEVVRQVVEQIEGSVDRKVKLEVRRQIRNERISFPANSVAPHPLS